MSAKLDEVAPCLCGGRVSIVQSYGGHTGCMTFYIATCHKCSKQWDNLGRDGTRRSAIRQWKKVRLEREDRR